MSMPEAVKAAIAAEIVGDPTRRGYDGKDAAARAALINAPYEVTPTASYRHVLISDVKGYLAAKLVLVRLRREVPSMEGVVRDVAEALLDILNDTQLKEFLTGIPEKRTNVLGMFAALLATGAGGLTQKHYDEIAAMTVAPPGPAVKHHPRWVDVMLSLRSADAAGLPNEITAEMIAEALA